jgi:tetratricopeptide (TPR) repeat protein
LTTSYNNIAIIYKELREPSKVLSLHIKALEIKQKTLPHNHPDLATSYNNIGLMYVNMNEHANALSYYEKALEIEQKTLSSNHSLLFTSTITSE